MKQNREIWIDNVKVIACILVVLGHFFQSMTQSGVLAANDLYQWFNQTIYYFHVPLFFICSGYLYQKYSSVNDGKKWLKNVWKKLIALGIPYFVFSLATWLLKTLFSSSVNSQIGGLSDTLFVHPASPYWYLYALFFLFVITPTFANITMGVIGLACALILKLLGIIGGSTIPLVSYILSNEIWFVLGMCLSCFGLKKWIVRQRMVVSLSVLSVFGILSVVVYMTELSNGMISFVVGFLACYGIVSMMIRSYERREQSRFFEVLAQYTMPIFLMHTLFAAPLRTVLFKLGIHGALIHVVLGIAISFVGPMIAAIIMKKSKWLEFFVYPGKFISVK